MEPLDPATHGGSVPRSPVPGPIDRESFFEAQRRHRRATWRLSALCIAAVAIMGIPLSLVLMPVLYTLVLLLALMWRARRYLADATAVQLTRYPDGLARALQRLGDKGTTIPGSS